MLHELGGERENRNRVVVGVGQWVRSSIFESGGQSAMF